MPITIQCSNPQCLQKLSVDDSIAGRNVRCKKCGTAFRATPTIDGAIGDTGTSHDSNAGRPGIQSGLKTALPAEFGRYRVEKLLGKGGMGAVYLAVDTQLGRQVALKIPFFDAKEEPKRLERFLREARSAARLHHPNICTIHDVGQHQGQPYITMAFITGKPLDELFDSEDLLPIKTSVNIVRRMALALQKAHELNIVHRDLKPANVMITPDGEPVIMDFGLAKLVGETDAAEARLTQDGAILGTPKYMAPEQVAGDQAAIGPQTDVYALGVILFELLTGRTPFSGPILQLLSQIASAPVPLVRSQRPEIQDALEAICQKALAKRPEDRFSSMNELAEALSAVDDAAAPKKRIRKEPSAEDIVLQDEVLIPQIDTGSSTRTSRRRNSGSPSSADARRKANTLGKTKIFTLIPMAGATVGVLAIGLLIWSLTRPNSESATGISANDPVPARNSETPQQSPASGNQVTTQQNPLPSTSARATVPTPSDYINHAPGLIWSTPPGNTWWSCATISPQGDLLVAGEDPRDPNARDTLSSRTDVPIRIWPIRNGQTGQDSFVIRQPGARTWTNAIRFSSDGRLMAVALNSGPIGLWRMDSSKPELLQTLNRFDGIVTALAISPDGRYLAAAKRDKGQPVVVWNIENPQSPTESKTWDVPAPQEPSALIFSQDSQTLFIGAGGAQVSTGEIYRWSYLAENSAQPFFETPSQSPGVIPVHPYVRSLALSRDGKKLAAAFSTLCFVIDADSGTLTQSFRGHSKPVISIGFAGQDSQCLSAGFDQSIRLWNISDGVQVWQNPSVTGSNEGLAISSDHRIAFSTSHQGTGNSRPIDGNVAQLWRLPDTQLSVSPNLPSAVNPVQGLTLNPAFNGRDLAGWKSFGGGTWTWENQELVGSPSPMGTPGFLMTESDYQDFEIRFDVFPYHGTNSGLFLRANPDGEPGGAGQIELQIIDDQFPQFKDAPYKTGALHGTFPTEADPGVRIRDWNSVRVRIEGRRLQAWINGQQTQNCDLNSVRDQFAAKPWLTRASGKIGLQISGNAQVRFRNIEILDLNSPQETVNEEDDSQPLFNGNDLTGWTTEGDVNHWNVVSGELQIANTALSRRGMLRTTSDYSDFLLTFEARMSVNVDAGITIRQLENRKALKINLLMGTANTFNQGTGSLWWPDSDGGTAGSKPPTQQIKLAPDVWNHFEIEAYGSAIVVRINNTEVQRADISTLPKSGSIRYRNGAIGFQSSSLALLSFRNIRLRTLNPGSTATDSSFNRAQP